MTAIRLTEVADESIRKAIVEPLVAYNQAKTGRHDVRPLVLALEGDDGGLDGGLAIDSIVAAQTTLSTRTDSPGVREWATGCRAWVEQNREVLAAAIAAGHAVTNRVTG